MSEPENKQSDKKQNFFEILTDFNSKDPAENILKCCVLGAITGVVGVVAATGIGLVVGGSAAVAAFGLTGLSAMKFVVAMAAGGIMAGSTMELAAILAPEKKQEKNAPGLKNVIRQHVNNPQKSNVRQADKTRTQSQGRPVTYENGQVLNYNMFASKTASIDIARNSTETTNQQVEKPIRKQPETRRNQPPSARGHRDIIR